MPHIRLRGLTSDHAQKLNAPLVKELSQIIGSPEDHFTMELVPTNFFVRGKQTSGSPFAEVLWFARDSEIQKACAESITKKIKNLTPDQDVVVVFLELSKANYYENGEHF
jgi:hypothetical protein